MDLLKPQLYGKAALQSLNSYSTLLILNNFARGSIGYIYVGVPFHHIDLENQSKKSVPFHHG